jgi:hypothetical protein
MNRINEAEHRLARSIRPSDLRLRASYFGTIAAIRLSMKT